MHQGTKGAAVRGESVVKVDAEEQNRAFRIQWNSAVSIYTCIHYYYFSGIGTSFLLLPFPFSTISPFVSSPRGQHTCAFAARPPATLRTTEAPHFPSAGLCTEPCSPLHSPRPQPPQCTAMQALPSPPPQQLQGSMGCSRCCNRDGSYMQCLLNALKDSKPFLPILSPSLRAPHPLNTAHQRQRFITETKTFSLIQDNIGIIHNFPLCVWSRIYLFFFKSQVDN